MLKTSHASFYLCVVVVIQFVCFCVFVTKWNIDDYIFFQLISFLGSTIPSAFYFHLSRFRAITFIMLISIRISFQIANSFFLVPFYFIRWQYLFFLSLKMWCEFVVAKLHSECHTFILLNHIKRNFWMRHKWL